MVAANIETFFGEPQNKKIIRSLLASGITWPAVEEKTGDGALPLSGQKWVITGTLTGLTREQAADLLHSLGAITGSAVSAKTTTLVAGEKPGSKLAKARAAGVAVMDGAQFLQMLHNYGVIHT